MSMPEISNPKTLGEHIRKTSSSWLRFGKKQSSKKRQIIIFGLSTKWMKTPSHRRSMPKMTPAPHFAHKAHQRSHASPK